MRTGNGTLSSSILDMMVHPVDYAEATARILLWARARESRYVCAANVHMVMEVHDDALFANLINHADLVTPDGMPLVWGLRLLGFKSQQRVYGPTLTLHVCEAAAREGIPIGLFGGTEDSLEDFCTFLRRSFPTLTIACRIAPPFRLLSDDEDLIFTQQIVDSGTRILFVGLGCPKQERWMAAHQPKIQAVMLGVGAAFDFHSGRVKQAPAILQKCGLEWFFRLCMEPRRLWKRYLKHNPRFLVLFALQLLVTRLRRKSK